jgi:HAD superfamily hydrolase (TIGR01484 family)
MSGSKAVLVTGRRLEDLLDRGCIDSFDLLVAENGALLYRPSTHESTLLAAPLPGKLVEALRKRNVQPLEIGQAIVATRVPHEAAVLEAIRQTGLEFQIVFNRDAVMALPPGVNKSTGLQRALRELGLSTHEAVSIGDAENDHSFLQVSECSAAVSNAVDSLKNTADIVTKGSAGNGVIELAGC